MNREKAIKLIEKRLNPKRFKHTMGVVDEAVRLAARYGCDYEKAEIAALLHDFCRNLSLEESDHYVKKYKLNKCYLGNSALAHAKIAEIMLRTEYDITSEEILSAVSYHTTGRAGMSELEQIIYLADAIEPGRNYVGVDELRKIAYNGLDNACLKALDMTISFVLSKGDYLHPDTIDARNYFLLK